MSDAITEASKMERNNSNYRDYLDTVLKFLDKPTDKQKEKVKIKAASFHDYPEDYKTFISVLKKKEAWAWQVLQDYFKEDRRFLKVAKKYGVGKMKKVLVIE